MITVNIEKAKSIAHDKRREARAEEFKPLDIQATIPSMLMDSESKRQVIREKYAEMQIKIDSANTADDLKNILSTL